MPNILLIAAGTALLVFAIAAKVLLGAPEKANKSEKAEIMKQLLALSDSEKKISGAGSAARSRPLSNQRTLAGKRPRNTTRIPQQLRTINITSTQEKVLRG